MNRKIQSIAFSISSFALPITVYLASVFLSDHNYIDYYSSNIDLLLISFIVVSIISEILNIYIFKKRIAFKHIIIGISAFIISMSLITGFYIMIGNVFEDIGEAVSQFPVS